MSIIKTEADAKKPPISKLRLAALAVLVVTGLAMGYFRQIREQGAVLGEKKNNIETYAINGVKTVAEAQKKELAQNATKLVDTATTTTQTQVTNIVNQATTVIADTASKSATVVGDFIFDSTWGNLLKQFDRLGETDRERIQKYICK